MEMHAIYRSTVKIIFYRSGLFMIAALFPHRLYARLSPIIVMVSIVLLVLVLVPGIGVERNFSQRWIQIGSFMFQPSEAVKLGMIIYFASNLYEKKKNTLIVLVRESATASYLRVRLFIDLKAA